MTSPPAAGRAEEAQARVARDLEAFRTMHVEPSPILSPESRDRSLEMLAEMAATVRTLDDPAFLLGLMRVMALADNGHEMVFAGDGAWRPVLNFPARMLWFPDALILARVGPELADAAGAEVLSIDGHTPDALMARLREIQGGLDSFRRWSTAWIYNSPDALHALGLQKSSDRAVFRLRLRDGREVTRTIVGIPVAEMPPETMPQLMLAPVPMPGEVERGWTVAATADALPTYLEEDGLLFRMKPLPELSALYVQFRMNVDRWEHRIDPFVAQVSAELDREMPRNLILDLRHNIGGDNTRNLELMRRIAEEVPGRIYVLVDQHTFSAGITSASAVKQWAGDKLVLVGGEVGDRLRFWSEMKNICLPESGICLFSSRGLWDLDNGCAGVPECFGDRFVINSGALEPHIHAPITSKDWLTGRDPAMEAVAADLRNR